MEFAFVFLIAVVMAMAVAIAYYLSLLQGCRQCYIDWLAWLLSQSLFACMLLQYNVWCSFDFAFSLNKYVSTSIEIELQSRIRDYHQISFDSFLLSIAIIARFYHHTMP